MHQRAVAANEPTANGGDGSACGEAGCWTDGACGHGRSMDRCALLFLLFVVAVDLSSCRPRSLSSNIAKDPPPHHHHPHPLLVSCITMSLALSPAGISPAASLTLARSLPNHVEELAAMTPFQLFQTQMEQGNTEAQVDAMKRLPVVAYAMGSAATLADLLPYLQQLSTKQLDDELLLLMAKQMQTFIPALLTTAPQMLELLPIVERLAAVEETVVRDQSVVCMNHICRHIPTPLDAAVVTTLVSMTKRLVGADWFTAKVSVAGMLPALHSLAKHSEIPHLYKELCLDETPMVRRAASQHLGALLASLASSSKETPAVASKELIPVLQQLCKDEQDSVRMLAVASLATVGPLYGKDPEWTKEVFLPLLKEGSTEMSWYVNTIYQSLFCFALLTSLT